MNKFIAIQENLIIGIKEIDRQHIQIAEIMNCLFEEIEMLDAPPFDAPDRRVAPLHLSPFHGERRKSCASRVTRFLDRLVMATRDHFRYEEDVMVTLRFPDLVAHRREHLMLIAELTATVRNHESGKTPIGREAMKSLKHWFLGHLTGSDSEIGRYHEKILHPEGKE